MGFLYNLNDSEQILQHFQILKLLGFDNMVKTALVCLRCGIFMRYKAEMLSSFICGRDRDLKRDAQRVCQADRSLLSRMAGTKRKPHGFRLSTNIVLHIILYFQI